MTSSANAKLEEIRVSGKTFHVPSAEICGRTVVVTGKKIRIAQVKDEGVVEGEPVEDPELFVTKLRESGLKADFFTFAQRPPDTTPRYNYHWEWDNWAAIPTACFKRLVGKSASSVAQKCKALGQARRGRESYTV